MADKRINDLPALVTQATTDVYEMSNNAATLSSKETRAQMLAYMQANIGTIAQIIWVNATDGDDANTGAINNPLQTINAALAKAKLIASFSTKVLIKAIGDFSITGDLELTPFVDIDGENTGVITLTGELKNDSNWDSTGTPNAIVKNTEISAAGGVSLTFTVSQQALIIFDNVYFSVTPTFSATGTDSANGELIVLNGYQSSGSAMAVTLQNVNFIMRGMQVNGLDILNISATNSFGGSISNSETGAISVVAVIGGTESISINGSTVQSLELEGTNILVQIDASSYQVGATFVGGANVSNINIISLSDGSRVNTVPTNYTPDSPAANVPENSVTAHLNGIDNALSNIATGQTAFGEMYFTGNSDVTTIAALNTPVKVNASAFNSGELKNFTQSGGTITYTGTDPITALVSVDLTATYNGSSQNTGFYLALNGSVITKSKQSTFIGGATPATQANPVKCLVALVTGDDLDIYVENQENANDIIVQDCNFTAISVNAIVGDLISIAGENYLSLAGNVLTANPVDVSGSNITGTLKAASFPALTGDVTTSAGNLATTIANQAVSYAKIQNVSTNSRLLGRYTAGAGSVQEIKLGTNLSLSGDTLNATASVIAPAVGEMYLVPINSLATPIVANAWTKINAGAGPAPDYSGYSSGFLNQFTFANGRLTYTGTDNITVRATMTGAGTIASGSAEIIDYIFFKNGNTAITGSSLNGTLFNVGTPSANLNNVSCQGTFTLATNDYLELFCKNSSVANPIFSYLNIMIEEIA